MEELKKLTFVTDFPPNKLKDGWGEIVCSVLNNLLDYALDKKSFRFNSPIHPKSTAEDQISEEADGEEVTTDEAIVDDTVHDEELLDTLSDSPRTKE